MKKVFIIFSLISFSLGSTINIPNDFPTIQLGINASNSGDTVIVAQGIYYENITIDKEIFLTSYAIFDNLENGWINNENIQSTIIHAVSDSLNPSFGSCLVVRDGNIAPTILGFTFMGGIGTVMIENDNCAIPINRPERSGGAILIFKAYPTINFNRFINNGISNENERGRKISKAGGAIAHYDDAEVEFDEDRNRLININHSIRDIPEQLNIQNNYFENNTSSDGKNFYSRGYEGSIDVSHSIFDDIDCESNSVNNFVLKSRDDYAEFIQNEITGNCIDGNALYVSVDGDNNNSGSEDSPVKTIGHAFSLVKDDTTITTTIYIGEGIFSPSTTGEQFPISVPDNVHLIGVNRENSILDAEADFINQSRVMVIERCENVKIANLTITGGNAEDAACYGGGGIYICPPIPRFTDWEMTPSIPILENLIVTGNHAYAGGGISIWEQEGPSLKNIIISNNTATWLGGGIMIAASVARLTDVDIFENMATEGEGNWAASGGGVFMDHGDAIMENVNIYFNSAEYEAGISLWFENNLKLYNSTIYDNEAETSSGGIGAFSFNGNITITNTIFWENVPNDVTLSSSQATITYSNIDWNDEGNIYANPLFTDAENGDLSIMFGSPCIDAGTTDLDGDGVDDIMDYTGSAPDIGAFEFYLQAPNNIEYNTQGTTVTISWQTVTNAQYYKIERAIDSLFIEDVEVNYAQNNFYLDESVVPNIEYYYRVAANAGIWSNYSDIIFVLLEYAHTENDNSIPKFYRIRNNIPNPFNPITSLRYDLPEDGLVNITIYDMMGRIVKTLVNSSQTAGYKSIGWNATNNRSEPVSAGLYLYTIQAGEFRQTKKMVLLK